MKYKLDKFYNIFSFIYPLVDVFLSPQKKKLFEEINHLTPGDLLDIGVGNGNHFAYYKKHTITGIDTSSRMLSLARENNKNKAINLLEMNGEALNFSDNVFDYVILSHVITVTPHPNRLLKEVYRVLKPNGKVFILNHFTPQNGLKYIDWLFQPFSKWFHFKSYFKIEDLAFLPHFRLVKETIIDRFSYFKLYIYQKS